MNYCTIRHHCLLYCVLLNAIMGYVTGDSFSNFPDPDQSTDQDYNTRKRWADAAYGYIKSLNCTSVYFTSLQQCHHLLNLQKRDIAVYAAQQSSDTHQGFISALPDGGLTRAGTHHGVVALDPHPEANFGHLVVVFFIDKKRRASCESDLGIYIGEYKIRPNTVFSKST